LHDLLTSPNNLANMNTFISISMNLVTPRNMYEQNHKVTISCG
jgi:hypothetical protein